MISFILPVYNQEETLDKNVRWLIGFLKSHATDGFEILICNDGSPDKSLEIADQLAKSFKQVKSIGYERNRGRGYAIKYAGMRATGEYFIYLDCDLLVEEHRAYLEQMIALLKEHDVVIASRFHQDAQSTRKKNRKFVSQAYRVLVKILFRKFYVTDPDVGFKGFKSDVFKQINIVSNLNGFSWDLQFLVNAVGEGYSVYEFPFTYEENYSKTTVNILSSSIAEFLGMIYIKVTKVLSDRIVF